MGVSSDPPEEEVTTENFDERDVRVTVSQPEGYMVKLSMVAKIPLPPEGVMGIMTDPENVRVFRNVKETRGRRVVWNDGNGKQLVEVEQIGQWKFLVFRGTFSTKLLVEEDFKANTVKFRLAKPGLMRRFQGDWVIRPFNQESLDDMVNHKQAQPLHGPLQRLSHGLWGLQSRLLHSSPPKNQASLVLMEQALLPSFVPPPPLDRLLKRIAGRQLMSIVTDLQAEAERINREQQGEAARRQRQQREGERERQRERGRGKEHLLAHTRKL